MALRMHEPFDFEDMRAFVLEAQVAMLARIITSIAGRQLSGIEYHFPYAPPAWADHILVGSRARCVSGRRIWRCGYEIAAFFA